MKSFTGMIRRIDDLGRVVIPKDVRRSIGIKEGDPFEIYTTNQSEVIFKKITDEDRSEENTYTQWYLVARYKTKPSVNGHTSYLSVDVANKKYSQSDLWFFENWDFVIGKRAMNNFIKKLKIAGFKEVSSI